MSGASKRPKDPGFEKESWRFIIELDRFLDKPLIFLSFVWIALIIIEFTAGASRALVSLTLFIWAIFILDFLLGISIAPDKTKYLRRNWLSIVSVLLPAFGVLRIFRSLRALRVLRFIRSVNLLRLLSSINKGMRTVRLILGRYGFGYIAILTLLVTLLTSAGMAYFESPLSLQQAGFEEAMGLKSYADALWWSAMMITTMGSGYWPLTAEGRILAWLLALYSFTFFSYITANIASHFVSFKENKK